MSWGNMGAKESGAMVWVNETAVLAARHENFQNGVQFYMEVRQVYHNGGEFEDRENVWP